MNINEKLDLITKFERRSKIKKILAAVVIALFMGGVAIYAQVKSMEGTSLITQAK